MREDEGLAFVGGQEKLLRIAQTRVGLGLWNAGVLCFFHRPGNCFLLD
jgi:hypothetical protein